jgi:hypothetical protein
MDSSPRLGLATISRFEMPVLVDLAGMVQLSVLFTDALGRDPRAARIERRR